MARGRKGGRDGGRKREQGGREGEREGGMERGREAEKVSSVPKANNQVNRTNTSQIIPNHHN